MFPKTSQLSWSPRQQCYWHGSSLTAASRTAAWWVTLNQVLTTVIWKCHVYGQLDLKFFRRSFIIFFLRAIEIHTLLVLIKHTFIVHSVPLIAICANSPQGEKQICFAALQYTVKRCLSTSLRLIMCYYIVIHYVLSVIWGHNDYMIKGEVDAGSLRDMLSLEVLHLYRLVSCLRFLPTTDRIQPSESGHRCPHDQSPHHQPPSQQHLWVPHHVPGQWRRRP